jgi:small-conductance mechanosensitive channel
MVQILVLGLFSVTLGASNFTAVELKQQANQFLAAYQTENMDVSQLDALEVSSQELLRKLQSCEKQAESDLSQLIEIREIGILKNDAKDSQSQNSGILPTSQATQEVDRQINETTQLLITCRLKSSQVAEARLKLINQKQNIWLNELTERQNVWSFISAENQSSTPLMALNPVLPITANFAWYSLLVLMFYAIMFWFNRAALLNTQISQAAQVSLKQAALLLIKLYLIPLILAWLYYFGAESNPWHLLVLVAGLLLRDSCALISIRVLVSDDQIKPLKRFMWTSSLLIILIAFGFNGIYFQTNNQTQLVVNYSQVFTPLILLSGLLLALSSWFFYQLLKNYRDRMVALLTLLLALISTSAFMFSYAYGAQYVMLITTGVLLLHWFLKTVNWLRKIVLSKKITQLKQAEDYAGTTFAFPFWVSLLTAICSGLLGLIFIGWLAGVSEEAFKQLSFVYTEGFDVGSVRLVPQDLLIGILIITILSMMLSVVKQGIQNKWFNKSRLRKSSREIFSMVVWYVGITIIVFVGLSVAGFDISNLAIIAGALSVGIGFGLQNIVSNFVSGLILLFERPINRGDWIEVGGTVGLVEKVMIRATRIRTFDNAEILVPNSELLSHHVTNWTLSNSIGRITLKVGVAYGSDIIKVRDILNDIALSHEQVIKQEPYKHKVLFRQFGDSSLNFELRVMIKDIKMILDVETELNFAIDKALREAQITIPFPQRDLHIKDASGLKVNNASAKQATSKASKKQQNADSQQQGVDHINDQYNHESNGKGEVERMVEEDEKRKKADQNPNKK